MDGVSRPLGMTDPITTLTTWVDWRCFVTGTTTKPLLETTKVADTRANRESTVLPVIVIIIIIIIVITTAAVGFVVAMCAVWMVAVGL